MKYFLSTFFLLSSIFSFSQDFSPSVNVGLLNFNCDSLNNLTISVAQDSNEVDIDTAYFSSNLGKFTIDSLSISDTVGFASMMYANGINLNTN